MGGGSPSSAPKVLLRYVDVMSDPADYLEKREFTARPATSLAGRCTMMVGKVFIWFTSHVPAIGAGDSHVLLVLPGSLSRAVSPPITGISII